MPGTEYQLGQISTDLARLEDRIALPVRPQSAQWQVRSLTDQAVPGPNRYSLSVALRFDEAGMAALEGQAAPVAQASLFIPAAAVADWFPAALTANLGPETNGARATQGWPVYDGAIFVKPGSSLRDGRWVRLGDQPEVFLIFIVGD